MIAPTPHLKHFWCTFVQMRSFDSEPHKFANCLFKLLLLLPVVHGYKRVDSVAERA
jgi:hypothetical protein